MAETKEQKNAYDPFEAWRGMQQSSLDAWAKTMVKAVNTEAYAQALGSLLDTYLTASSQFRETIEKTMSQSLQQLNMPSRSDILSLADRLTNLEMRLDDIDAKIDQILSSSKKKEAK